MTTIDEKEILEIEKLKQDIKLDMKKLDLKFRGQTPFSNFSCQEKKE